MTHGECQLEYLTWKVKLLENNGVRHGGIKIAANHGFGEGKNKAYVILNVLPFIPSFRANYNVTSKLKNYVYKNLRGKTKEDTIDNINKVIDQINPDYDSDFSVEDLANELFNIDINDISNLENDVLKDSVNLFLDVIKKTKKSSPLLEYIKETTDLNKVDKLEYIEKSLENDLIQLYKSVFTNDNVLNELLTPVDFDHMKNDIIAFREELSKDDTYDFNAYEDIKNKALFKAGKAGVGMLANALVDHIRGRMGNLRFENYNIGAGHIFDGETKFDEEYSTELNNSDLKIYVKLYEEKTGTKLSKEEVGSLKKIKISHSLSAVLNGNVDIAKDPFITEGNWNTATTGVGNMLLRAGVHPFHVNAFLRHPILKKYIEFQNNKESKIVNESGNIEDKFKLDLIRTSSEFIDNITINDRTFTYAEFHKLIYGNYLERDFNNLNYSSILNKIKRTQFINSEGKKGILNKKDIENNQSEIDRFIKTASREQITFLSESKTPPGYFPSFKDLLTSDNDIRFNRQILSVFNILKEDAKKMKKNIDASTQDVKGPGKNSIELVTRFNNINDMLTNNGVGQLVGFESKLIYNGVASMLGHYTNNIIFKMMKVVQNNSDLFFTVQPNIINNIDQISIDLKNEKLLDGELGREIEKGYISYILSGFKGVKTTTEEFKELTSQGFIDRFTEFKKSKGTRYKILEDLDIVKGEKVQFINMSNRTKDSDTQYELTKSWLDMLRNDNEMASDLIKYSFITSSFNMNKGQFYTYIPFEFFIENGINEYLRDIENKPVDINFIEQFYENNYTNGKIVPKFFDNQIAKDDKGVLKFDYRRVTLDIKKSEDVRRYVKYEYKDEEGIKSDRLYKLIGFNPQDQPVYIRVPLKNIKDKQGNQIYQYSTHNTITENVDGLNTTQLNAIDDAYNQLISLLRDYSKNVEKTELPEVEETFEVETKQEVKSEVSNTIYSELGNKTKSKNVVIKSWGELKDATKAITSEGIISTRIKNINEHFGNPFSHDPAGKTQGLIKTETIKEAVEKFTDWVINSKDERANWIREQLKSGELKGKPILYYKELGEPSHATALDYLINKYDWNNNIITNKSEVSNNVKFEEEQTSGYANRTRKNASADATIAFAIDFNTAGEKLTKSSVLGQNKKYIPIDINDDVETDEIVDNIINELNSVNAKTLNIAGNGIYTFGKGENVQKNLDDYVYEILKQVVESPNLNTKIESIRSGGQTGIDEAGTKAGIKLGLKTLTLAPKGWIFRNVDNKDISNEQQFKARFSEFNKPQQLSLFETTSESIIDIKKEALKTLFFKSDNNDVFKGSVVEYKDKKWIVWNISDNNKAQLIDTEGNKFSGTPMLDKLTKIGDYITTIFNGTDYIVTSNENIYSLDTGKQVFTSLDNSTKTQKERIITQILDENNLSENVLNQINKEFGTDKVLEYIKKCKQNR